MAVRACSLDLPRRRHLARWPWSIASRSTRLAFQHVCDRTVVLASVRVRAASSKRPMGSHLGIGVLVPAAEAVLGMRFQVCHKVAPLATNRSHTPYQVKARDAFENGHDDFSGQRFHSHDAL